MKYAGTVPSYQRRASVSRSESWFSVATTASGGCSLEDCSGGLSQCRVYLLCWFVKSIVVVVLLMVL